MDRRELGLRMQFWHKSQWDPIYMVGSIYYINEVYPDKSGVEDALNEFNMLKQSIQALSHITRRELVDDISEIAESLQKFIDEDYVVNL